MKRRNKTVLASVSKKIEKAKKVKKEEQKEKEKKVEVKPKANDKAKAKQQKPQKNQKEVVQVVPKAAAQSQSSASSPDARSLQAFEQRTAEAEQRLERPNFYFILTAFVSFGVTLFYCPCNVFSAVCSQHQRSDEPVQQAGRGLNQTGNAKADRS